MVTKKTADQKAALPKRAGRKHPIMIAIDQKKPPHRLPLSERKLFRARLRALYGPDARPSRHFRYR